VELGSLKVAIVDVPYSLQGTPICVLKIWKKGFLENVKIVKLHDTQIPHARTANWHRKSISIKHDHDKNNDSPCSTPRARRTHRSCHFDGSTPAQHDDVITKIGKLPRISSYHALGFSAKKNHFAAHLFNT